MSLRSRRSLSAALWLATMPLVTMLLVSTGCGGGGSSGGGGGSTATVGTFTGGFTITITAPGNSVVDQGSITIVVQPDGTVIRDPATDGSSGMLVGNSFEIVNSAGEFLNDASLNCIGTIRQTGTVEPGRVNGTFASESLACNGVPFTLQGTFSTQFAGP